MKKYITAIFIVLCLGVAFSAAAQTVKRTQKQPSFFVPEKTLQQAHTTEKLPTAEQMLQHSANANIASSSAGYILPQTEQNTSSVSVSKPQAKQKARKKMQLRPAPIDKILKNYSFDKATKQEYKNSILASYYLSPSELKQILQAEAENINADTKRMIAIKNSWASRSTAFKIANYKLNDQISTEMSQTTKNYKKRKQKFDDLLKKSRGRIAIIEATDPLFWNISTQRSSKSIRPYRIKMQKTSQPLHFVSVFDDELKHVFSYHRKHINPSKNRSIAAAQSGNPKIDKIYQPLFDSYLADLGRISSGLDINNPILLRQIGEMQNKVVSESY